MALVLALKKELKARKELQYPGQAIELLLEEIASDHPRLLQLLHGYVDVWSLQIEQTEAAVAAAS